MVLTKPDLDWSFDYIPTEDDGGLWPAASAAAEAAPRPARKLRRISRWLLVAVPALALLAALGAYGFQYLGWQRLAAQVSREVITEDEYARAGDVAMVRSFLAADDEAWTALRAAEARQGLPVTLPPGNLRPVDAPPQIEAVELIEQPVFAATVLRAFQDPAGQVYHFRYTQRYRNLGPGLWERLPTDQSALALHGHWAGQRLDAIFPMQDWPWMQTALPRIDGWLAQACADWECPDYLHAPITLTGLPGELRPVPNASATPPAGPPSTPLVFNLGPQRPLYPPRVVLPSLQAAGTPVEEAASEALLRAVTVHALRHLAQQLAGLSQDGPDFYLEALVARAETRLGLSPALHYNPPPDAYVPPPGLWSRGLAGRVVDLPTDLSYRLQALAFLNFALADAPASADGALLRGLRRQAGLVRWLQAALGPEAERLPAEWTARVTTSSAPGTPLAWQRLDGLSYACEDGAWLIRGRGLQALWSDNTGQPSVASTLSAGGRYLATLRFSTANGIGQLRVLELDTGRATLAAQGRFIAVLGWSSDDRLLFLQSETLTAGQRGIHLMRYDPAGGSSRPVIPNVVRPVGLAPSGASEANWSPDRTALVLTANVAPYGQPARWEAIHVRVAAGEVGGWADVQRLGEDSYSPILSPDGARAALGRQTPGGPALELVDLVPDARTPLVTAVDPTLRAVGNGLLPERLLPMAWSPDGQQLIFMATGADYGDHLFAVEAGGQGLRHLAGVGEAGWVSPLGFSADGRYLGYFEVSLADPTARLQVLDTHSGQRQDYAVFPGSVSWSSEGHLLALAVEEGAYVLDPASGDRRWLAFQTCQRVSW